VSADPLFAADDGRTAPPTPRPAGVVDLGRYRGRTAAAPAVVPPARVDGAEEARPRSAQLVAVSAPVRVPDWERLAEDASRPERAAAPVADGEVVLRRVRLRSVFKMVLGFSLCTYVVVLGAGVLLWSAATGLGVVDNLESLAEDLGWVDVQLDGPPMLRSAAIGGGILVVTATFLSVVFAEVFNLLSTITGGLRAEVGPPPPTRRERRRARKAAKG